MKYGTNKQYAQHPQVKDILDRIENLPKPKFNKSSTGLLAATNQVVYHGLDIIIKLIAYWRNADRCFIFDTIRTSKGIRRIYQNAGVQLLSGGISVDEMTSFIYTPEKAIEYRIKIFNQLVQILDKICSGNSKRLTFDECYWFLYKYVRSDRIEYSETNLLSKEELIEIEKSVRDFTDTLNNISIKTFDAKYYSFIAPGFGGLKQADLILDNTLIDIKSTNKLLFNKDTLAQLLYYYFLLIGKETNYHIRRDCLSSFVDPSGELRLDNIAIYYTRFDYLFTIKLSDIIRT